MLFTVQQSERKRKRETEREREADKSGIFADIRF
jgi:hypothetical protein